MSGLKVVGIVAGIVSAFAAAVKLFNDWKEKKQERKEHEGNVTLSVSFVSGSDDIQNEYDQYFAKVGRKYAIGDGRSKT